MANPKSQHGVHSCECSVCQQHPRCSLARNHRDINRVLAVADERSRRLLAGLFAKQMGRGGISQVARITGLDRNTITKGQQELRKGTLPSSGRVRRKGGGRKRVEDQSPGS